MIEGEYVGGVLDWGAIKPLFVCPAYCLLGLLTTKLSFSV